MTAVYERERNGHGRPLWRGGVFLHIRAEFADNRSRFGNEKPAAIIAKRMRFEDHPVTELLKEDIRHGNELE